MDWNQVVHRNKDRWRAYRSPTSDSVQDRAAQGLKESGNQLRKRLYLLFNFIRYYLIREAYQVDSLFDEEIHSRPKIPQRMYAFVTNICNARCTFCQYPKHTGKKMVLKQDTFEKALDEYRSLGIEELHLTPNNGDPLVDPKIVEKMKKAREAGIKNVYFQTNGILLSRGNITDELVKYMSRIGISLPGLDSENYLTVYGVDKAKEVEEGIIKLAESKISANSDIRIELDLRIDRPVEEVMQDPGMQRVKPYLMDGTVEITDAKNEMFNWSGVLEDTELTGIMTLAKFKNPKRMLPCHRTLEDVNAAMLPNGGIRVCMCGRGETNEGPLVIGDINTQKLSDIIFGEKHRALLRNWMLGDVPDDCRNCAIYEPTRYSWSRLAKLAFRLPFTIDWWRTLGRRDTSRVPAGEPASEPNSQQHI